jgi:hypothetical protein
VSAARRGVALPLVLAGLLAPCTARGYRPVDGTDAAVAAPGELELELEPLGYLGGAQRTLVAPGAVLNLGFWPGWEAVAEGRQLLVADGAEGGARWSLEDLALSVKHVLRRGSLDDGAGPDVAAELGALLPDVHGAPGAGAQLALVVSQAWPAVTVHLNLLGAWTRAHVPGGFGSLIVEGPGRWPVRPVSEVSLEVEQGRPWTRAALAGLVWQVRGALAIDGALRIFEAGAAGGWEVRAGLTWVFPVLAKTP